MEACVGRMLKENLSVRWDMLKKTSIKIKKKTHRWEGKKQQKFLSDRKPMHKHETALLVDLHISTQCVTLHVLHCHKPRQEALVCMENPALLEFLALQKLEQENVEQFCLKNMFTLSSRHDMVVKKFWQVLSHSHTKEVHTKEPKVQVY